MSWVTPESDIAEFLRDGMNWIETIRFMIAPTSDTFLLNIFDDVVSLRASTLD